MEPITIDLLHGIEKNGPTDPIEFYRRPLVGSLFRRRINLGLSMLPSRPFKRGLEVGYGAGGLLISLARGVDDLHGIDLDANPESVTQMLRTRGYRATLKQGSVERLPYADSHFDLIVCFSVFEHLRDYRSSLAEVRRVLSPSGLFLLGMPSVNRTMELLFRTIGHDTINDIHITTPEMIRDALPSVGFKLVDQRPLDVPFASPLGVRLYHNWLLEKTAVA